MRDGTANSTTLTPAGPERNRLLAWLASDEYARLVPELEPVRLEAGHVLSAPGDQLVYLYFPRTAVVSLQVALQDDSTVEGTSIGNEGLIGLALFLGAQAQVLVERMREVGGEPGVDERARAGEDERHRDREGRRHPQPDRDALHRSSRSR